MENLLEETKAILAAYGKTLSDIDFVTTMNGPDYCNDELVYLLEGNLEELLNVEYDDSFGGAVVVEELKLVGKDFWLERHTYDGSEWWEFKQLPTKPERTIKKGVLYTDFEEEV